MESDHPEEKPPGMPPTQEGVGGSNLLIKKLHRDATEIDNKTREALLGLSKQTAGFWQHDFPIPERYMRLEFKSGITDALRTSLVHVLKQDGILQESDVPPSLPNTPGVPDIPKNNRKNPALYIDPEKPATLYLRNDLFEAHIKPKIATLKLLLPQKSQGYALLHTVDQHGPSIIFPADIYEPRSGRVVFNVLGLIVSSLISKKPSPDISIPEEVIKPEPDNKGALCQLRLSSAGYTKLCAALEEFKNVTTPTKSQPSAIAPSTGTGPIVSFADRQLKQAIFGTTANPANWQTELIGDSTCQEHVSDDHTQSPPQIRKYVTLPKTATEDQVQRFFEENSIEIPKEAWQLFPSGQNVILAVTPTAWENYIQPSIKSSQTHGKLR